MKFSFRRFWWLFAIFSIAIIAVAIWGIQWATYARPPLPEAVEALESDDLVQVTNDTWLTFAPKQSSPISGFVFYPGGRIDPRGYAPLLREIAAQGYLVVVPKMPINMAVFDANVADEIMASFPEIDQWAIGGHSIGGTMAAQYAANHHDIGGLAIWASYPTDSTDLSGSEIPVVSIYGNLEPRVNDISVAERKHLLPDAAIYVRIEGGDHHQFGSYVIQPDEHFATISRKSQQEQIVAATLTMLEASSN